MQTWLRTLPRLEKRSKSSRKNRRSRSAWRSNFDARDFGIERLEDRVLLTVDLAVTKTAAPPIATVGSNEVYSVVVTNKGTTATTGLTNVSDTLPANINPLTVTATDTGMSGAPAIVPGLVTDTIPIGFAAGASATLTITVSPTATGALVNTALAQDATDLSTGTDTIVTPVQGTLAAPTVDLSVTKAPASNPATSGTADVYTIVVKNNETTNNATGVILTDNLPANATYSNPTAGATITGTLLTDTFPTLAAGASQTVTVSVTPNTPGSVLVNTAVVAGDQADPNAVNNTATTVTPVSGPVGAANTVDLSVTKTAATTPAIVGTPEVYTIVVKNNSATTPATLVTLVDTLPVNGTYSTPSAGTITGNVLTDVIGNLAAGATSTVTVSVTPTAAASGGVLVNTASVAGAEFDNNLLNNVAATTTPVGGGIAAATVDLSVTKAPASNPATEGAGEVYTIVIKNNSATTAATGVILVDNLPVNGTYSGASAGATITGNVLTDSIGNLASNTSATVTVTVTPNTTGLLVNTAAVAGNQLDNNLANNTATTVTPVSGPVGAPTTVDLSVTKSAATSPAIVGAAEVYTIVVKNNSATTPATGVNLIDTLPLNGTYSGASAGTTITGNVLTDAIGNLAAGASTTVTVSVTPTAAASGGTLVNSAVVAGNEFDNNLLNNVAATTTPVGGGTTTATVDLSVTKTAASNPAIVGTAEVYTVVVKNNSATTGATGVTLVDTLPVNANAYTTSAGTITGNVLTDAIGSLAAGASATVTVSVTPTAGPTLVNTAVVAGNEADNNLLNNVAATTTPVGGSIPGTTVDLSVTKTPASNPAIVGTAEVYTIVVKNNSATTGATGVTLVDTLPTNANAYTTSAGTITGNVLTDAIGNLAAGASTTVTVSVTATAAAAGGSLVNTASVAGNEADNNLLNNVVTTTTPVTTPASLTITKLGPPTGTVGTSLTYTITISNIGGAATTAGAATVSDTLPAGLTLVSAVDTAGMVTVSPGSNSFTDSLGALAAATGTETIIVTATPTSALSGQTVTNTATLTFNATTQTSSATTSIAGSVVVPHVCYLAGVPGDGTARTFITNLYHELLGREPDAPSMTAFLNYLAQHDNIVGRHTVEEMFLNSPEYAAHYVSCLYEIFLGRSVDAGGLAFWTQKMGQVGNLLGHTGSADEKYILAAILGSTEYYNNAGGTAQGWINALYQDLLGRSADSGGTTFWTTLLGLHGGDRDGIARDLLSTPEAVHDLLFGSIPGAGTAAHPLPANGMPAGQGGTKLDEYTGGGYVNLYFQGAGLVGGLLDTVDQIFGDLVGDYSWNPVASVVSWDTAISLALATPLYYTNPARPVVAATTS